MADSSYFRARLNTTLSLTSTIQVVDGAFNEDNVGDDFSFNATTGVLTFDTAGLYLVCGDFKVTTMTGTGTRSCEVDFEIDTEGGFVAADIDKTFNTLDDSLGGVNQAGGCVKVIQEFAAGDDCRFQAKMRQSPQTGQIIANDFLFSAVLLQTDISLTTASTGAGGSYFSVLKRRGGRNGR